MVCTGSGTEPKQKSEKHDMSILFGIVALVFGSGSFAFGNPAGVPVFGLAFAAAGFLRESRARKRTGVFVLLSAASLICAVGTLRSFEL